MIIKLTDSAIPKGYVINKSVLTSDLITKGTRESKTKGLKRYTLIGQYEKNHSLFPRLGFGILALIKTVSTLGFGLISEETRSNWGSFFKGKKVVVIYNQISNQSSDRIPPNIDNIHLGLAKKTYILHRNHLIPSHLMEIKTTDPDNKHPELNDYYYNLSDGSICKRSEIPKDLLGGVSFQTGKPSILCLENVLGNFDNDFSQFIDTTENFLDSKQSDVNEISDPGTFMSEAVRLLFTIAGLSKKFETPPDIDPREAYKPCLEDAGLCIKNWQDENPKMDPEIRGLFDTISSNNIDLLKSTVAGLVVALAVAKYVPENCRFMIESIGELVKKSPDFHKIASDLPDGFCYNHNKKQTTLHKKNVRLNNNTLRKREFCRIIFPAILRLNKDGAIVSHITRPLVCR